MTRTQLIEQIHKKKSLLCIGLDSDPEKIPAHLRNADDPIYEFNKTIIEATHEFAVAYKPNVAFYESEGVAGWESLAKTIDYLNEKHPEVFTIADAKRGDIGNTSTRYARAFLEEMNFDSVTVAPYMGSDSVQPFLEFEDKWVILLALTSNPGAADFQMTKLHSERFLFEEVLEVSKNWGNIENTMYVVGATQTAYLKKVRAIIPDHFLLVPGIGAQGGSLEAVIKYGMGTEPNLLINSSRGIIYASSGEDFAEKAREQASLLQNKMENFI